VDPIAAASALIEERFPECLAAFVAGSVLEGRGTPTSDLDMVVITLSEEAPYRESLRYGGWPVELFVHSPESYKWYFDSDAKGRAPALANMCLGHILRDVDGMAGRVRADAEALLTRGPEALTKDELDFRRYLVTDLLDDFEGSTRPEETVFVAASLLDHSIELLLAVNGKWSGKGKWMARALDALDPKLTCEAISAIQALHGTGDRKPLASFAHKALEAAGGRLWEGYRAAGKRTPPA
jgi:hypothetical protein